MTTQGRPGCASRLGGWHGCGQGLILFIGLILATTSAEATPRMISYGYPNCISCHVSVQGRGLLNGYGRGIEMAQSYSKKDFTAMLFARIGNQEDPSGNWDGRFGSVLLDFLATSRASHQFDTGTTDRIFAAVYRQVLFFGERDLFRINTEFGFQDSGLADSKLGPHRTAIGGDALFIKKMLIEWRINENGTAGGQEVAFGRDYLPLGLHIDDYTTFLLHLNRNGIYDYPLQLKYFFWNEKSLASAFVYAPSFEEPSDNREYGGGALYERYPTNNLALGVQTLAGFADESDRLRIGGYIRWGISNKWTLLSGTDYSALWQSGPSGEQGSQVTAYAQLYYHHYEWLVSSVTANYAFSDVFTSKDHLNSFRYTTSARLNRNLTVGITYSAGDILRDLGHAQELALFATIKF